MRNELDGIKTKKGRVVYDRAKNPFKISDFQRMSKKLLIDKIILSEDAYQATLECIVVSNPHIYIPDSFGGGHFGGAGATRTFVDGLEMGRIIILMEGK